MPDPGDILADRFVLEALAGAGGMGEVWRALDRASGTRVALKLLLPLASGEADRFEREAHVLARLEHPGVVRYVAHDVSSRTTSWLAMEWLEGEDLATRLQRGPLPPADAISLCARAAEALAVAHAMGVVHRDVKPSNLFLLSSDASAVKLLDFGIARLGGMTLPATRAGHVLGTPGYMSPEQARGETTLDARSDVFALGCVLFECLTGRPAFAGAHAIAVLAKILLEEAPLASSILPGLSEDLDALVARMLCKDPAGRPRDGTHVKSELDAVALGATGRAPTSSPPAVGAGEQRRMFVVIAGRVPEAQSSLAPDVAETLLASQTDPATWARLRRVAAALGAHAERLGNGAVVATLSPTQSATDAAAIAARCAIAFRRELSGAPIAVATGSGRLGGTMPMGDVIERAVDLVGRATPGGDVSLDEGTAGLLDARFEIEASSDGAALRGERPEPGAVRKLLGRPTPCVGRDRDLAMLVAVLAECVSEPVARAIVVTAPPGIGKSRLLHEVLREVERLAERPQVWAARGDPLAAGSPFGMLGQLVRATAAVREGDPDEVKRRSVQLRVARRAAPDDAKRIAEFLGEICGVPAGDDASVPMRAARQNAQLMADQTLRAWLDFAALECRARPLMIVLDDLHWGDLPTVKYVDAALKSLADAPLFVLALARPEIHETFPNLWRERGSQEVRLAPLTKKNAERLARETLAERAAASVVDRIVDLAGGNAFYLEELIRAVAQGRDQRLPESVLAMAQVRHEALEPEARRVLRAASVFGEVFWTGGVRALLGVDSALADIWLPRLIEQELIEPRSRGRFAAVGCAGCEGGGEAEHVFRHALLREAAYAALTPEDRMQAHGFAADWLESAGESDALRLAEHNERAARKDAAAQCFLRAAQQALDGGDEVGAIERARRGIAAGPAGERLGALHLVEAEGSRWLGRHDDASLAIGRALELLPRGSAAWCRAVGEAAFGQARLVDVASELVALDPMPDAREAFAICSARVCSQLYSRNLSREADALFARLEHETAPVPRHASASEGWIAEARGFRAYFAADDILASISTYDAAHRAFERAGDRRNSLLQRVNKGLALTEIDGVEEALEEMVDVIAQAERLGLSRVLVFARLVAAYAVCWHRPDEARAHAMSMIAAGNEWLGRATLVEVELSSGRPEEAAQLVATVGSTAGRGEPHVPIVALLPARVLLAQGRPAEALCALPAERRFPSRFGWPLHLLVRAEALHLLGERDEARSIVAQLLKETLGRAERIADVAVRSRFLGRKPDHARLFELARAWGLEASVRMG